MTDTPRSWIAERAAHNAAGLQSAGFTDPHVQVIKLQEECGEFAKAYLRASGNHRTAGTVEERDAELADVVITGHVIAAFLGVDLDAVIARKLELIDGRGWRETPCEHAPMCSLPAGHEPPCSLSLAHVSPVDAENARRLAAETQGRPQP